MTVMGTQAQINELARGHVHVARIAYRAGDYHAAYRNLNSALYSLDTGGGALSDNDYREMLHLLGKVQVALKLYPEAEQSFNDALVFGRASSEVSDSETMSDMRHLAESVRLQNRYTEAEKIYLQCLEQLKSGAGKKDNQLPKTFLGLAQVYIDSHRFDEAEKALGQAISQFENNRGTRSFWAGRALLTMARLRWAQGYTADSLDVLQQAMTILEPLIGPHHPLRVLALRRMAGVLDRKGDMHSAGAIFAELREAEKYLRDHDN